MSHLFDLTGKVALVIGGTPGGIGHAQALGLAEYDANVIMASSNLNDAEEVAGEIRALGRQSLARPGCQHSALKGGWHES